MKFEAYILIPIGIFTCFLLLSGIRSLQKIAVFINKLSIKITSSGYTLNVSVICFFISLLRFIVEIKKLIGIQQKRFSIKDGSVYSSEAYTRLLMEKMRLDRNFWILLFSLALWFFIMRMSTIFQQQWKQIDEAKEKCNVREKEKKRNIEKNNINQEKNITETISHIGVIDNNSNFVEEIEMVNKKKNEKNIKDSECDDKIIKNNKIIECEENIKNDKCMDNTEYIENNYYRENDEKKQSIELTKRSNHNNKLILDYFFFFHFLCHQTCTLC